LAAALIALNPDCILFSLSSKEISPDKFTALSLNDSSKATSSRDGREGDRSMSKGTRRVSAGATCAYTISYIFSQITVTNEELRRKALAEKDITPEQYDQMQKLQRISTKDENGNVIEEKVDDPDLDTDINCRLRIKKLVSLNLIPFIVKLAESKYASEETRKCCFVTMRQVAVEEIVRGPFIQQGGFTSCLEHANKEYEHSLTRREAAHAISKILVTTNPIMLSEHLRMSSIRSLVHLCRESDSSNLQQFEALLALTNLTSFGSDEQNKLADEK